MMSEREMLMVQGDPGPHGTFAIREYTPEQAVEGENKVLEPGEGSPEAEDEAEETRQ